MVVTKTFEVGGGIKILLEKASPNKEDCLREGENCYMLF